MYGPQAVLHIPITLGAFKTSDSQFNNQNNSMGMPGHRSRASTAVKDLQVISTYKEV